MIAFIIIILVLLIGFALAARFWGQDSREGMQSSEWTKRTQRNGASVY